MRNLFAIGFLIVVLVVAILHIYFCVLEMFLWQKPLGLKTFKMTPEQAAATATLAGNQGLYNLFLAMALLGGIIREDPTLITYGLTCVSFAGIYGAVTVSRRIFFVQSLPALIALGLGVAALVTSTPS